MTSLEQIKVQADDITAKMGKVEEVILNVRILFLNFEWSGFERGEESDRPIRAPRHLLLCPLFHTRSSALCASAVSYLSFIFYIPLFQYISIIRYHELFHQISVLAQLLHVVRGQDLVSRERCVAFFQLLLVSSLLGTACVTLSCRVCKWCPAKPGAAVAAPNDTH